MTSNVLKAVIAIAAGWLLSSLLLAGLPWTYFLGLFTVLVFVSFYIARPMLFLASLFFFRAGIDYFLVHIRFGFGGLELGLAGAFSLLLTFLVAMTYLSLTDKQAQRRVGHPLILMYAAFCFYSLFNAFYSIDLSDAIKVVVRNFATLAIMIIVTMRVNNEEDAYCLLKAIAWSFIPSILFGFVTPDSMYKEIRGFRYCGTLSHPNIFAFYLIVILACFLTRLHVKKTDSKAPLIDTAGFISIIAMLVLTRTRSGWIAAIILFAFYSWYNNRRLIIPAIFVCIGLLFIPMVSEQITSLVEFRGDFIALNPDSSFAWRLEKWGLLFAEAIKKPIFGHGMGADTQIGFDELPAHNDYLHFFVNSGIIGLSLYVWPFLYLIRSAAKTKRQSGNSSLLIKLAQFFLIYIPSFLIMSVSDNLFSYGIIQWYFWAIVGIYISLSWNEKYART